MVNTVKMKGQDLKFFENSAKIVGQYNKKKMDAILHLQCPWPAGLGQPENAVMDLDI